MWNRRGIVLALAMGVAIGTPASAESGARAVASPANSSSVISQTAQRFVMRRVVADRVLRRNWAVLEDRDHPERPPKMVQLAQWTKTDESSAVSAETTLHGNTQQSAKPTVIPLSLSRPYLNLVLRNATQTSAPRPLLVRAGDRVHLWSISANVRLEIEAVSLDFGHAGQIIHVRRLGQDANQRVLLTAVVNGEGSAELLP